MAGVLDRALARAGTASGALVVDVTEGRVRYSRRAGTRRAIASNMKLFTTSAVLDRLTSDRRLETSVWQSGTNLYLRGAGDPVFGTPLYGRRYAHGLVTSAPALAEAIRAAGIREVTRIYADDSIFDRIRGVADSGYRVSRWIGPLSGLAFNGGFLGDRQRRFSPDPARTAAQNLRLALARRGIEVPGAVRLGVPPQGATQVASALSPPLSDLVREANRYSDNFFAEMLLKRLGAEGGRGSSTARGARMVRAFARRAGSSVYAVDGSGLTRSNRASPRAIVALLRHMWTHPASEPFFRSLAEAGRSGTLHDRMRRSPARGRCFAKTGSLIGISALSGYCRTRSERVLAFSILMNGASVTTARRLQDRMAGAIVRYG